MVYFLHRGDGNGDNGDVHYLSTFRFCHHKYDRKCTSPLSSVNPFGYTGEYTDNETGLIYLRNRYYDPELGMFITEDPAKDGLNWYAYCNGNPVMFVDPWGLDAILLNKPVDNIGNKLEVEHMGAFFQDNNSDWWFFFWGDTVQYVKVDDPTIFESLDSINKGATWGRTFFGIIFLMH